MQHICSFLSYAPLMLVAQSQSPPLKTYPFRSPGFQHSSFTFAQESGITKCSVASTKIPPGSLIAHLQRALNYVQAEVNLTEVKLMRNKCA